MIIGVINGYYRSGTTLMQRLCSENNPNYVVLCEPTQHEIIDHIISVGCDGISTLHGWEVFKGYCKLTRKVRHEFIKRHFEVFDYDKSQWGIMTSEGAVRYLLQPLHDCEQQIVIKSTQLHLFLEKLKEWYGCWILHLDRNIENIIADHFSYNHLTKTAEVKNIFMSNKGAISFYANLVFENLTKYLRLNKNIARNNLDKLVFNILATRKIVEKQKGITVLNFDDFVRNPKQNLNKLPFKINESLLRILDPYKANPVPNWLKDMINSSIKYIRRCLDNIGRW